MGHRLNIFFLNLSVLFLTPASADPLLGIGRTSSCVPSWLSPSPDALLACCLVDVFSSIFATTAASLPPRLDDLKDNLDFKMFSMSTDTLSKTASCLSLLMLSIGS